MSRELDFSDPCYLMNVFDCLEQRIAALESKVAVPSASDNTRMNAIAFASSWCEKYGWNPDVIENFADALVEWQQRHA